MLVLSRRIGEQLVIDGNIILTVISVDGNKTRLGVQAPPDVRVDREEIHRRRRAEELPTPMILEMETPQPVG